jgi:hypothetical protein
MTLSESAPALSAYGLPSTMLRNSLRMGSVSVSDSVPAAACRYSSIITGTFIVLAAWNRRSGSMRTSDRPSSVLYATATSAPLAAMMARSDASRSPAAGFCRA